MVIHLDLPLLTGSSSLPESKREPRLALPYLALLRTGFTMPPPVTSRGGALLPHRFTLTSNQRLLAVCFLWHFPGVTPAGRYPAFCSVQPGLSSTSGLHPCRDHPGHSERASIDRMIHKCCHALATPSTEQSTDRILIIFKR